MRFDFAADALQKRGGGLKDNSVLRETMRVCQNVIDQCALASEPSREILETATTLLERVRSKVETHGQWVTAGEVLRQGVDSVLFPVAGSAGIETPWPTLTEMTSGWSPSDL